MITTEKIKNVLASKTSSTKQPTWLEFGPCFIGYILHKIRIQVFRCIYVQLEKYWVHSVSDFFSSKSKDKRPCVRCECDASNVLVEWMEKKGEGKCALGDSVTLFRIF